MRDRKGFTLIELLIVVVIIGILAAIAIPKFSKTRERAYVSAMKSDLRNLANQQELWYADVVNNYIYAGQTQVDDPTSGLGFAPTSGVAVVITNNDGLGWGATATHDALGATVNCGIYFGDTHSATPATVPGQLRCVGPNGEV
jgi:type IV pilus assembly protein PilA